MPKRGFLFLLSPRRPLDFVACLYAVLLWTRPSSSLTASASSCSNLGIRAFAHQEYVRGFNFGAPQIFAPDCSETLQNWVPVDPVVADPVQQDNNNRNKRQIQYIRKFPIKVHRGTGQNFPIFNDSLSSRTLSGLFLVGALFLGREREKGVQKLIWSGLNGVSEKDFGNRSPIPKRRKPACKMPIFL